MKLLNSTYGNGRVRVMRLSGEGQNREVRELTVLAMLAGDIARAYTQADNSTTVSTDSIKNVVNVVAREELEAGPEAFCRAVAKRLLNSYPGMTSATVSAREVRWNRLTVDGTPHLHAFTLDGNGQGTAEVVMDRDGDRDSSNGKSIPDEACRSGALGQFWPRLLSQIAIAVRDIAGPMLHEIPWICRSIAFSAPFRSWASMESMIARCSEE